mgnify:CR=1 FL=1|tara:strand:- start:47 stop:325 length:279 start_codon:yes stop_codon:yes gene_type:complete
MTYKQQLRAFVLKTFKGDDELDSMLGEVDGYDESRCKGEYGKILVFSGFAETLKEQLDDAGSDAKIEDIPIVQAENKAIDAILRGQGSTLKH